MTINYDALRAGAISGEVPDDGAHQARLDRAALVETSNGERLVTEWSSADGRIAWTSWNRFDTVGMSYTRELLMGLGIDMGTLTDDEALKAQLQMVEGALYEVRTSSQKGTQGDRWFTTTYCDGRTLGVQERLDTGEGMDVPIDTDGLPGDEAAVGSGPPVDDDIPF